ncbi:MAG: glycosyltransferase [bacterium]
MFSVVIPTFNEAKFLGDLLLAIKAQTIQPVEIIVADNHSSDQTRMIAKQFGCKIVSGGSPAVGRNHGARAVTQKIIFFLDADVELASPDFFARALAEMNKESGSIGSCRIKNSTIAGNRSMRLGELITDVRPLLNQATIALTGKLFSDMGAVMICTKALWEKIAGFDEKLYTIEDTDFFRRAVAAGGKYFFVKVTVLISPRRFIKRSRLKLVKMSVLLIAILTLSFFGIKKYAGLHEEYQKEKGKLGG